MKRSIISIALCVALVLSTVSAMFVMPASAANGIDFLLQENIASVSDGAKAEFVDGKLVITATAAGQEVALAVAEGANLNVYPYWEGVLESDIPFDIAYYDPNNSKWMFAAGDFCYNFNGNQGASSPIAAGSENVKMTLSGAYTWTGAPLPENAIVKSVTFIAKAAGTITVSKCAMTDGLDDVNLDSPSFDASVVYDNTASLLGAVDAWTSKTVNNSDAVVTADGESLVFSNTAGAWPSAYITFAEPYVVNAANAAINANLTVKQASTVYLYLNGATADMSDFTADQFVAIKPTGAADEIGSGCYAGTQVLADILPEGAVDADGNVTISGIAIFATGTAGSACAIVENVDLLWNEAAVVEPVLYTTLTAETLTHEGDIKADEEIKLNVTASAASGLATFHFGLTFDDAKFEYVDAEWGTAVAAMAAADGSVASINAEDAVDGVKRVNIGVMATAGYDIADNDVIVTVTLKAKEDITENAEVAIVEAEAYSFDAIVAGRNNEYVDVVNGGVEIVAPAFEMGDVDMNGEIDIFDVQKLFKHVNEETLLDDAALAYADVYGGDGEVDIFDVQRLFKFVNEEIDSLG